MCIRDRFYAVPRIDVNPLAHRLLDIFGSLSGVLEAPVEELVRKGKVSYNTAVLLHICLLYTSRPRRRGSRRWPAGPIASR